MPNAFAVEVARCALKQVQAHKDGFHYFTPTFFTSSLILSRRPEPNQHQPARPALFPGGNETTTFSPNHFLLNSCKKEKKEMRHSHILLNYTYPRDEFTSRENKPF